MRRYRPAKRSIERIPRFGAPSIGTGVDDEGPAETLESVTAEERGYGSKSVPALKAP
jgi:acetyl-CoA carboxylase alpha subunit